jgi:cytochrome c oxidase subunit 1
VVAHFHYTLFPSAILGSIAGVYFWFPKMFGRMLNETLGKIHFAISFLAFNCVFIPLFFVGMTGHMRRIYNPMEYNFLKPIAPIHEFVTYAAIILILAQGIFVVNVLWTFLAGKKATDNPWQANTLEWATSSPPPMINFETVPTVYRDPYEYSPPGHKDDWLPQWQPTVRGV